MENKIAIIGIIIEDRAQADRINALLHENNSHIIGRMGMPYDKKQLSIISIIVDADDTSIGKLATALGALDGVSVNVLCSNR